MAKKPKPAGIPALPVVPDPIEVDTRTPLQLEVAYRWHRGEEAIAVQVYRDAHPEAERPDIDEAMELCATIAGRGPVSAGYQPPGADPGFAPIEGVVHPPDPAYLPTEHTEPLPETAPAEANRYAVLGEDPIDHAFSLTPEERLAMFGRATDQDHLVERLKDEHAAERRRMKDELTSAETERSRLLDCASKGVEVRSVKVSRVADYVTGVVEFRLPGGAVLKTAPLKDDDRQLQMFREHVRARSVVSGILAELLAPAKVAEITDADPPSEGDGDAETSEDDPSEPTDDDLSDF